MFYEPSARDRTLLPQAIEEGVRWESPLLTITRVATRDTELGGVQIPAGATVMPMLGAADSLNAAVATAVMAYEVINQWRRS